MYEVSLHVHMIKWINEYIKMRKEGKPGHLITLDDIWTIPSYTDNISFQSRKLCVKSELSKNTHRDLFSYLIFKGVNF